jgi:hypothetical protein
LIPRGADRGYFNSTEILACEQADITVTLPKPMTSGAKADGRFGKQDFVYLPKEDVYRCPAGERLTYRYTREGQDAAPLLNRGVPPLPTQYAKANERRIKRWEHEHVLEVVQQRLDAIRRQCASVARRSTLREAFHQEVSHAHPHGSRIATKTVIVAGQEGRAFQLAGRLDTVGRRGVDNIYSSIAIGDEVRAP